MAEMTYLRSPKLWLLSTAALILSSQIPASAQVTQNYHAGAPTMVAAAPSLPTISPEQIARDVVSEINPRTGTRDLIAAPFDPFEEDPTLAGSLRLRSADGVVAIDGYPLRDGALVEIDFYYNSPSDDPYGGRNYGEAAFVNGDLAPVVKRDTRIIECSTRVENVVYDQASYYGVGGYSAGLYRPYRHYAGHSAFGFGFGNSYFGPGYSYFDSSLISFNLNSFGGRPISSSRFTSGRSTSGRFLGGNRNTRQGRFIGSDRNRDRDETRRTRRNLNAETDGGNEDRDARRRLRNTRRSTDREAEDRVSRVQSFGIGGNRNEVRRNIRSSGVGSSFNAQPRIGVVPATNPPATAAPSTSSAVSSAASSPQSQSRRSQPRRSDANRSSARSETRSDRQSNRSNTRSNTRSNSGASSGSNNRQPNRTKKSTPRRRISPNGNKRKLNFFPVAAYGGRGVVTTQSVDCAREDKLTIFIPNARLDAARFDGLTLIALDAQGGEAPIYLPPNYIEGFRLAATGQVSPQNYSSGGQAPRPQSFGVPALREDIEAAPCPTGTSKQPDGTCLQASEFGYPR